MICDAISSIQVALLGASPELLLGGPFPLTSLMLSGTVSLAVQEPPALRLGSNSGTPSLFGDSTFLFGLNVEEYAATWRV